MLPRQPYFVSWSFENSLVWLKFGTSDFLHCTLPHLLSICCAHVPNPMTQRHLHILSECFHFQNLSRCLKLNFNLEKGNNNNKENNNNKKKKKRKKKKQNKTKQKMLMQLKRSTYRQYDSSLYSWEKLISFAIGYSVCRDVLGRIWSVTTLSTNSSNSTHRSQINL